MCNYIKIETGQNFLPVLKKITHTVQVGQMLMLLSVHMTSLVRFNNDFGLLLELHALTLVARSYVLLCNLIPLLIVYRN